MTLDDPTLWVPIMSSVLVMTSSIIAVIFVRVTVKCGSHRRALMGDDPLPCYRDWRPSAWPTLLAMLRLLPMRDRAEGR